ncbi:MAG: AbrB/MazE/SpoVT family DNA-binding domain-containing protein [Bryobacterales bacterium]|nr:AbrB/MazE/SpoVT family DNA-binding domain-containing protein [Bryobacterales bacterium]
MTTKLILDKAGRVVIPKALREELHLAPGDALELNTAGEQITLRPVRASVPIRKEDGVWVYRSGQKMDVSIRKVIEEGRDERRRSILGRNE